MIFPSTRTPLFRSTASPPDWASISANTTHEPTTMDPPRKPGRDAQACRLSVQAVRRGQAPGLTGVRGRTDVAGTHSVPPGRRGMGPAAGVRQVLRDRRAGLVHADPLVGRAAPDAAGDHARGEPRVARQALGRDEDD